jgi:hypothetical protein
MKTTLLATTLGILGVQAAYSADAAAKKPNIFFIAVDDLRPVLQNRG